MEVIADSGLGMAADGALGGCRLVETRTGEKIPRERACYPLKETAQAAASLSGTLYSKDKHGVLTRVGGKPKLTKAEKKAAKRRARDAK